MKSKAVFFYLLMLLAHLAHVFEETLGGFWILRRIGPAGFLAINGVLFSIPVVILCFILSRKRWAYLAGLLYAGLMGLNGIAHNIAAIVTGRYFDGFAGGISGIALILIAGPLIFHLKRETPGRN